MKKIIYFTITFVFIINSAFSQNAKKKAQTTVKSKTIKSKTSTKVPSVGTGSNTNGKSMLNNDDIIKGLKEALTLGTTNSSSLASKLDGFYKNPLIFIPFPPEVQMVKDKMDALGMQEQTKQFVETLNRAAEEAAKNAAPVFINAITSMSIADGFEILKGADNAATSYLVSKTSDELRSKFSPVVQAAIDKVELTKAWNPIITNYNRLPFVQKQNPDLTGYVTQKAMDGLFKLIAEEELKIRKDPAAQVSSLLQNVFGSIIH